MSIFIPKNNKVDGLPWLAAMAFFMQSLDATILNTAIPSIAETMHRAPLTMQSAIISYTLTVAMLIPISGWLADRFGTRKVFITAVSLFTLGSLFCALSESLTALVVSRVIQGIGGAMMMPVARLTLLKVYPRNEFLSILNFVTMPGLLGPVLGPMLGGLLVTYASWQWIFFINIPIGLVGIFYARHHMPNLRTSTNYFDFKGFFLFGTSLVLLTMSMELFGEQILLTKYILGILATSIALFALYIVHARHYPQPLIDLPLFKTRTFSIGIIGNIASRLGTGAIPFLIPLMLQVALGHSATVAGCMMMPIAIGSMLAKSLVTKILKRFGYRKTLVTITFLIGGMIAQFSLQASNTPTILLIAPLFLLGVVTSIQFTSMNTITLSDLTNKNASSGNSILAVTQQISISLGIAVSAAILSYFKSHTLGNLVYQFHATFITIGIITMLSSIIFMWLHPSDGNNLLKQKRS